MDGTDQKQPLACMWLGDDDDVLETWQFFVSEAGEEIVFRTPTGFASARQILKQNRVAFALAYVPDPEDAGNPFSEQFPLKHFHYPPLIVVCDTEPDDEQRERFRLQGASHLVIGDLEHERDREIIDRILGSRTWFAGDLKVIPIADVLTMLGKSQRKLMVTIDTTLKTADSTGHRWKGRIYIDQAQLMHVETATSEGLEAFAKILAIEEGTFRIHQQFLAPREPNCSGPIDRNIFSAFGLIEGLEAEESSTLKMQGLGEANMLRDVNQADTLEADIVPVVETGSDDDAATSGLGLSNDTLDVDPNDFSNLPFAPDDNPFGGFLEESGAFPLLGSAEESGVFPLDLIPPDESDANFGTLDADVQVEAVEPQNPRIRGLFERPSTFVAARPLAEDEERRVFGNPAEVPWTSETVTPVGTSAVQDQMLDLEETLDDPDDESDLPFDVAEAEVFDLAPLSSVLTLGPGLRGASEADFQGVVIDVAGAIEAEIASAVALMATTQVQQMEPILGLGRVRGWCVVTRAMSVYTHLSADTVTTVIGDRVKNPEVTLRKLGMAFD